MANTDGAKRFLRQYQVAKAKVTLIENEIAKLAQEIDAIKAIGDGLPRGTEISDRTGNIATKLADKTIDLVQARGEAMEIMHEIAVTINEMENPAQICLLWMRYIDGASWDEIAVALNYSRRQLLRIHARALIMFERVITDKHHKM